MEFDCVKTNLKFGVIRITPQQAEVLLASRRRNRNLSPANVNRIISELLDGKWRLNGETLVFDKHEHLVDGQNRLKACVDSGVPIVSCAVFGVDYDTAFHTIDSGRTRTNGDVLDISGVTGGKNGRNLAAALRWVYLYENDLVCPFSLKTSGRSTMDKQTLLECANTHEGIIEWVSGGKNTGLMPPACRAALAYLFAQKDRRMASEFFVLANEQPSGKAMSMLRSRLIKNALRKEKLSDAYVFALSIKAWNGDRLNADIGTLKLSEKENVQRII